jgi:hypothetical protein
VFLLLLGSLLLPTSLLLFAFMLLVGFHKLVSDWMALGHFHSNQFSTDIQLVNVPHFWKVAVTTAIWHRRATRRAAGGNRRQRQRRRPHP